MSQCCQESRVVKSQELSGVKGYQESRVVKSQEGPQRGATLGSNSSSKAACHRVVKSQELSRVKRVFRDVATLPDSEF